MTYILRFLPLKFFYIAFLSFSLLQNSTKEVGVTTESNFTLLNNNKT